MPKLLLTALFTGLLGCLSGAVFGQTSLHRVYKVEQPDGRVAIFGINQEAVPYSVLLEAKLTHMQSSLALPARAVIAPSEKPQLLAVFTPEGSDYRYTYTCRFDLGAYTGLAPDTSVVYALPFKASTDSLKLHRADNLFIYSFLLPPETPVLAAREGVVAAIKYSKQNSTTINSNLIYIYHNDGTHACYENVKKNSAVVRVGQQVKQGDVIGYFGTNKQNSYLWFSVEYPTESATAAVPVVFRVGNNLVRPRYN